MGQTEVQKEQRRYHQQHSTSILRQTLHREEVVKMSWKDYVDGAAEY